jgi:hypothetical protein
MQCKNEATAEILKKFPDLNLSGCVHSNYFKALSDLGGSNGKYEHQVTGVDTV